MKKFIKKYKFSPAVHVWAEAKPGARTIHTSGKYKNKTTGENPMLTLEAENFQKMEARGVKEMMELGAIYQIVNE